MGLRDLYDKVEKAATPLANRATRTPEFAQAAALVSAVDKAVRGRIEHLQTRVWHAVNLPAGSDVRRLKQQVGSLDREVRLLSLELRRARTEGERHGDSGPEHD